MYDQIDTKKSGFISQNDLVKAVKTGRRSSIAKVFGEQAIDVAVTAFSKMDSNGNGKVTWKEFFDKAEEAFVHDPLKRQAAPRRQSLLAPATVRRPSYQKPPAMNI